MNAVTRIFNTKKYVVSNNKNRENTVKIKLVHEL